MWPPYLLVISIQSNIKAIIQIRISGAVRIINGPMSQSGICIANTHITPPPSYQLRFRACSYHAMLRVSYSHNPCKRMKRHHRKHKCSYFRKFHNLRSFFINLHNQFFEFTNRIPSFAFPTFYVVHFTMNRSSV